MAPRFLWPPDTHLVTWQNEPLFCFLPSEPSIGRVFDGIFSNFLKDIGNVYQKTIIVLSTILKLNQFKQQILERDFKFHAK